MHARGEKIAMLTAYDATFAAIADAAGVDCILVGDSLGMVCQGLASTVGVDLAHMRYHTESVARGLARVQGTAWLIGDLPFGTYHESREQALRSAAVLMQAGAHMVKLEGGGWTAATVEFLVQRGVPVCAHLGLTPQTVHSPGGYRVHGKGEAAGALLKQQAHALQDAGAAMLVLEMVPAALAAELTTELTHCATNWHWRRLRHRRASAGHARHVGPEPGPHGPVCTQLSGRRTWRARGHDLLCASSKNRQFS